MEKLYNLFMNLCLVILPAVSNSHSIEDKHRRLNYPDCVEGRNSRNLLDGARGTFIFLGDNTSTSCKSYCKSEGYRFAVTKDVLCMCAESIKHDVKTGICDWVCPGDGNEVCGGKEGLSLHNTGYKNAETPEQEVATTIKRIKTTEQEVATTIESTEANEQEITTVERTETTEQEVTTTIEGTEAYEQEVTTVERTETTEQEVTTTIEGTEATEQEVTTTIEGTEANEQEATATKETTELVTTAESITELSNTKSQFKTAIQFSVTTAQRLTSERVFPEKATVVRDEKVVSRDTYRVWCFSAEVYLAIQAGVVVIVAAIAGAIFCIWRKRRLQLDTDGKHKLNETVQSNPRSRAMETDDDYLNASLQAGLASPAAQNADNGHLSELLQSNLQSPIVTNADNEVVNVPLQSIRVVAAAEHEYVDINYDQ